MVMRGYVVCPKCGHGQLQESGEYPEGQLPVPFHRFLQDRRERVCHGTGMVVTAIPVGE